MSCGVSLFCHRQWWVDVQVLPSDVLKKYEVPQAHYTLGWSRGKETLENGLRDLNKGSFYAVPFEEEPAHDGPVLPPHFDRYREITWVYVGFP